MNRQVILATGAASAFLGDIEDMRPDLSKFGIVGPVSMRPLPWVDPALLVTVRGRQRAYVLPPLVKPLVDNTKLKRRALAMTRQGWSVSRIAARLEVSTRSVNRWRQQERKAV